MAKCMVTPHRSDRQLNDSTTTAEINDGNYLQLQTSVCECVCVRERKREIEREKERKENVRDR